MEVVGVAADAVYRSLRDPVPPTLYIPLAQHSESLSLAAFSVRTGAGSPAAMGPAITQVIGRVDADLSVTFRTLGDQVDAALVMERLLAMLSGFFGVLALLLSGVGLYGVTSYAVNRRRTEVGIRLALGATPGGVIALVLSRASLLVGGGIVMGAFGSYWAAALVTTLTFGVEARDLATFAGAAAALAATGVLAAWLPARRASRIEPALVLREG